MINILFFAELQEKAGKAKINMEVERIKVSDLKEQLQEMYQLPNLDKVMVAVNEEYARNEDMISAGDTVAFIPPVSGG